MSSKKGRKRAQRGSVQIEFVLFFPLLLLLFFGVIDFGQIYNSYIRLTNAALAGAQFGSISGRSANYAGMKAAATNTATGLSGFSVTASQSCACSPGGATVSCATTCATYGAPVVYVVVSATASAPSLFHYGTLGVMQSLSSTAILRVQ